MMMRRTAVFLLMLGVSASALGQSSDDGRPYEPVPVSVSTDPNGGAPSDAIVLFDGSDLDSWHTATGENKASWDIADGVVTVTPGAGTLKTKQAFGDIQLHLEWRPTDVIQGSGQGRGNSGLFLSSLYEVQILDSWENPTYTNGQAGSVYLQHTPLVNASRPPGQWQSYDIIFKAPVFSAGGVLESPAHVTVLHNGVLVLNNVEIKGSTFTESPEYAVRCVPYGQQRAQDCSGKMPLTLQDHGQIVSFRNIWVREL